MAIKSNFSGRDLSDSIVAINTKTGELVPTTIKIISKNRLQDLKEILQVDVEGMSNLERALWADQFADDIWI